MVAFVALLVLVTAITQQLIPIVAGLGVSLLLWFLYLKPLLHNRHRRAVAGMARGMQLQPEDGGGAGAPRSPPAPGAPRPPPSTAAPRGTPPSRAPAAPPAPGGPRPPAGRRRPRGPPLHPPPAGRPVRARRGTGGNPARPGGGGKADHRGRGPAPLRAAVAQPPPCRSRARRGPRG